MVLVLKEGATKEEMEAIDQTIASKNKPAGFNAKKYNGILPLNKDPLKLQEELRNEWERNIS